MAPPTWVILSREARSAVGGDGADLSVDLAAPPGVTVLVVGPRVSPSEADRSARCTFPCVVAADPSAGLLLLLAPPPPPDPDADEVRAWSDDDGNVRMARIGRISSPRYFVCDVASATASRVPDPDDLTFSNDFGVIAAPGGGGHYMVAAFDCIVGCDEATLLCYSSETGEWVEKDVDNPLLSWIWTFYDVFAHDGKLWWVDTAAGLLSCDPFADEPVMEFVPLPEDDDELSEDEDEDEDDDDDDDDDGCGYCSERELGSRRCVQLSDGKFRCVEMSCGDPMHGAPKVSMRTLADPKTGEWTLEYEASFDDIWAGESYKATKLSKKAPSLALVHPKNPDVVYFSLGENLFAVDMRAKKVVECQAHDTIMAKKGRVTSHGVLAWELPPALAAGLSVKGTATSVDGESTASPVSASSDANSV